MKYKERFFSKVQKTDTCWEWTDDVHGGFGYGRLWRNGRYHRAHRVSYELHKGEIPDGMQVNHTCNNSSCVNPDHLYLGTQRDNIDDRVRADRSHRPQGVKHPMVKLTEDKVLQIRQMIKTGMYHRIIAEVFGVHKVTISDINTRKRWAHL